MSGKDFADAVVLITGASTGLGRAIAVEVAERGAGHVIVNYASSAAEAEETARLVENAGAKAILAKGDVGEDADCIALAKIAAPFGRIDALFNNAGVTKFANDHSKLDAVNADDFHRLYRVNVVGAFQMIRACRDLLEAAERGVVVNTASIAAVVGVGSSVPYVASKGALVSMTLSLARALAPKIRVNAVCPGYIDTPWFGKNNLDEAGLERLRQGVAASMPLKAASTPEDIAGATVFLASPAARHITGETLIVDAGMHLGYAPMARR